MCGIVGIIGNYDVSREAYNGLLGLFHRGPNASGMISFDGQIHEKKGLGKIDAICGNCLGELTGHATLGHNRYVTIGKNLPEDAQPHFTKNPSIIMAHNGNILNVLSLREEFGLDPSTLGCDVVYPLNIVAKNLKDKLSSDEKSADFFKDSLVPCFEAMMNKLIGAYSIVAIIENKGLVAVRDPHGIRPLSMAKTGPVDKKGYAFASENRIFDPNFMRDYNFEREVSRGELIFIDNDLNVFNQVIREEAESFCPFEPVYFAKPDSSFKGQQVFVSRYNLGKALAREFSSLKDKVDVIMPIPNTPIIAGMAMGDAWNKPVGGIVKNPGNGEKQAGKDITEIRVFLQPTPEERKQALNKKYIGVKEYIQGKRILLVDDSTVRGDTSTFIVKELRERGAAWVGMAVTFRPYKHPCIYGIDTAEREKLISYNQTDEEVRQKTNLDHLVYLSLDRLLRATNLEGRACTACMTGVYPTSTEEYFAFEKMRKEDRAAANL